MNITGYEIEIKLGNLEKAIASRRIIVPSNITFQQFHEILSISMGWEGDKLYEFVLPKFEKSFFSFDNDYELSETKFYDADQEYIFNYLENSDKFEYIYDFGFWLHEVKVTKLLMKNKVIPKVIEFEGDCPPEDCGGISGYKDFLEAIDNPDHENHENAAFWFDEIYEEYDMEYVNYLLTEWYKKVRKNKKNSQA